VTVATLTILAAFFLTAPGHAQEIGTQPDRPTPAEEAAPLPIIKAPSVLEFVEAEYPEGAKTQGTEATVGLAIEVSETGEVLRVEVMRPAGQGFDEAAIAAVEQMKFAPAETTKGPVAVAIEFEYNFTLSAAETAEALAPINLEGTVIQMGTRDPAAGVAVTVRFEDQIHETTTGDNGEFGLRGMPVGKVTITVDAPGHARLDQRVRVKEGEVANVKLWIRPNVSFDEDMLVEAKRPEPDISRRSITVKEIQRIPGTFGDPVRVIQNLPGTARAPFGTGLVVVRGSNPEDTAFYVDGIRVPLIYHLGGLVSIVNEDIVASVDYLPGGYGVEYGRSTGGVINIRTNAEYPERVRAEASVDLLDATGVVQGRVGKDGRWGLTAAGRRSYLDAVLPLFTKDSGFTVKPYWWDYQFKVDDLNKDSGKFSVLFMGFGDKLYLGTPDNVAQGSDPDSQGDADVRYGAHRIILQYNEQLTENLLLRMTPSAGIDTVSFGLGNNWKFGQEFWLYELRADALWELNDAVTLRPGIDFLGGPYGVDIEFPYSLENFASYDPLSEREDSNFHFDGTLFAADPFIEAWIKPLGGSDALNIVPGLRFNSLFMPDYTVTSLDPRISMRAKPWENSTFKAGTGLYHQPPQGPDLGFDQENIRVDYEQSWSSEVGWEQRFSAAIETDVTLFHKKLTDLIVENPNLESSDDAFFVNAGEGRVRGLEAMIRHNPVGDFFGWISYTLSKAERAAVPLQSRGGTIPSDADEWRPFEYDQTHILVALAGYELPWDAGFSARFRYVTGNPYTPYDGATYDVDQDLYYPYQSGEPLSDRLAPFMALDLRADKRYTFKHWWLETYIDLLNVVRGENPEGLQYNYDYTEEAYVRGLPFLPSFGLRAEVAL
jgi:TonB family protein